MMALLELIFNLPKNDRNIKFTTIAEVTDLPLDNVEHLLMKAMSLNLIRGKMDEVKFINFLLIKTG